MDGGKRPGKKGKKHLHVPTFYMKDAHMGGIGDGDAMDLSETTQVPNTQQQLQIQHVPPQQQPAVVQLQTQIQVQMAPNQQTPALGASGHETGDSSDASGKLVLDPTTVWFDDEKVKKVISRSIQGYYRAPWRNYGQVDDATKTHWWNLFNQKFTWAIELDEQVRWSFHSWAGSRLRDMFYTVTHQMNGAKPNWVSETIHKQMLSVAAEDDVCKKRSAQNKKNRRGGSISAVQHAKKLASKNGGKLSSAPHLSLHTHFKDVLGKGKGPVNTKAKQIAVEEASTQGIRIQRTETEMYCDAVGGGSKKGRVKGLGRGAGMPERSGSSEQYTPSVVSQMQEYFEKRLEIMRTEMRAEMEAEIKARVAAHISSMERRNKQFMDELMDEMLSRMPGFSFPDTCSTFPYQLREPRDDPTSSAGHDTPACV